MGENKILKMFFYTCIMISMILFPSCYNDKNDGGGTGPEGGITNCCGNLGKLDTRGLILYYSMDNLPDTVTVGTVIEDLSGKGNDGKFKKFEPLWVEDTNEVYTSVSTDGI
ncbi:MAG: hypothetical protein PVI26_06335, partial [Chitinispirillia bacterium]